MLELRLLLYSVWSAFYNLPESWEKRAYHGSQFIPYVQDDNKITHKKLLKTSCSVIR